MPTIKITDDAQNPVVVPPFKLVPPPALFKYLKSEVLHLIAADNFVRLKDETLTQVATPNPLHIGLQVGDTFQLGNTQPEISLTPTVEVMLAVNATTGANLFDGDSFPILSTVPPGTAYVGLILEGSLDPGMGGSAGHLTFGMDRNTGITFGYWRNFSVDANQPTLVQAFVDTLSNYGIAGDLTDVSGLREYDICTVSGRSTLKVSGGVTVTASPNPLAAVNLPFNAGRVALRAGPMADLTTSFVINGSYQIRVRRLGGTVFELSYFKQRGTTLTTEASVGDGIAVDYGTTDIFSKLLGAIDPDTNNAALLSGGLTSDEVKAITTVVKSGIDHSLRAAFDESLFVLTDDEAAFQYQIDLAVAQADPLANAAVHRALEGDLSHLTALENKPQGAAQMIAPGVKLLRSVFATTREKTITFRLNLLGLVNVVSMSDFIRKTKVVHDEVTGDVTMTDFATASAINAIIDPLKRHEALRRLLFDSATVTAAYSAGGAFPSFALALHDTHSALNQNTRRETVMDYLRWFEALKLITPAAQTEILSGVGSGGTSTCFVRTQFTDAECRSMFMDIHGQVRQRSQYLDIGRNAMLALLDPNDPVDKYRRDLLENYSQQAFANGPTAGLADLVGLLKTDPRYVLTENLMEGDVYDIAWWASGMADAAVQIKSMTDFLAGRDSLLLFDDHQFQQHRQNLAATIGRMVKLSKTRFQEPWGMVSLFYAAGESQGASGKLVASHLVVVKP